MQYSIKETLLLYLAEFLLYTIGLFALYFGAYTIYWKYICSPNFQGKTVFITGASSGIGEELAKQFAQVGVSKMFLASRRIPELERVKSECLKIRSLEIECVKIDLAEPDQCLEFAKNFG